MKLFGIEITRTKMAEKFKGFFDTGYGAKPTRKHFYLGEHSWLDRCTKFDRLCEAHPLAKQTLQALGVQFTAKLTSGFQLKIFKLGLNMLGSKNIRK